MPRSPSPEYRKDRDIDKEEYRERERDYDRKASSSRRDDEDRHSRRDDKDRRRGRDDDRRDKDSGRDRERDKDRDRHGDKSHHKRERSRSREKSSKKEKRRETPSPSGKSKRKEAKAAAKAASKREAELEQARALAELSMYSATDNPFHDANLGEQFSWHKKREKEKKAGLSSEEIARKDAIRRMEAKEELERLNKKRAEREVEMALRDEEEARMQRLAESAQMAEWIAKEDDFQLEQSRRRAGIRLREHRAKAIDFLAINLRFADAAALGRQSAAIGALTGGMANRSVEIQREEEEEGWGWADAGFEFEIDEPWKIFENLNLEDCVELENDIRMYVSLEKSPINIEFWEAMQVVCTHHLEDLRDPDRAEGGRLYDRDVDEAASKIVSGLSLSRLVELENKTNAMLRSGQPVDGEFWDLVLRKITVEKAISKLNSIHEIVIKNRLEQFKKRQREDAAKVQAELGGVIVKKSDDFGGDIHAEGGDVEDDEEEEEDEDDYVEEYKREMSPELWEPKELAMDERRLPIVNEEDDLRAMFTARHAITSSTFIPRQGPRGSATTAQSVARPSAADLEAERIYREEAERELRDPDDSGEDEEFGDLDEGLEVPGTYDWSDRYRPRKPRFFNRVHTGYEWSKYNQTHYDTDNPPPKVVQGYKFNIFYPDLIDKTKAPTYYVKQIPGDPDTAMLVFTAGPPYEDIAFRIVRRPWEHSHRKGFRSTFDRGVLQLYFNFGRSFYKK